MDEIKALQEMLTQVRLDIRELTTEIRGLKDLAKRLDETDDKAIEALQSTRAAHHRLDRIDKIIYWAGTTVIGAIIIGLITLLIKSGG